VEFTIFFSINTAWIITSYNRLSSPDTEYRPLRGFEPQSTPAPYVQEIEYGCRAYASLAFKEVRPA
jgi:hypothetical protein